MTTTLMIREGEILMEQTPEASLDHRCLLPVQTCILLSLLGTKEGQIFSMALPMQEWATAFFPLFFSPTLSRGEEQGMYQGEWKSEKKC